MGSFYSFIYRLIGRMLGDQRGNVVMMFGIMIIPTMGLVGGAIDFANASRTKSKLQAALDAATLAAARAIQNGEDITAAQETADSYIKANLNSRFTGPIPSISLSQNSGVVTAKVNSMVDTYLLGVMGIDKLKVTAETSVAIANTGVEVALVLDTTGSMAGDKLLAMQHAGRRLVKILMPNKAPEHIKIALVPFSDYVNIGMEHRNEEGIHVPDDYEVCKNTYPNSTYSCEKKRINTTCYSDGKSYPCTKTIYENCTGDKGDPVKVCPPIDGKRYYWSGCVASREAPLNKTDDTYSTRVPGLMASWKSCRVSEITRLTNHKGSLISGISNMKARGETYIPAGLIWGWRLLSNTTPFADGAPYSKNTRKAIVLMTDGANSKSVRYSTSTHAKNNEGGFIWDHKGGNEEAANTLTSETCENIKDAGIRLFTIAFEVSDTTIKDILSNCAGNGGGYYDAKNSADLLEAFEEIASALSSLRLTN